MSVNTPLQLANALRSYPHFCGETCPLCNAAAELERARGAEPAVIDLTDYGFGLCVSKKDYDHLWDCYKLLHHAEQQAAARLREMGERGDYWFDLYQREGADHLNDIQRLEQLERDREALRKDAERFNYLQNADPKHAQQFFWNYSSRKQRAEAIDKEIAALGGKS
jgi:hypothetical protein